MEVGWGESEKVLKCWTRSLDFTIGAHGGENRGHVHRA